jgi:hypothetical protein
MWLAARENTHIERRRSLQSRLYVLAEVAREFGEVKVFAPDVDRASSGHALGPNRPIAWKGTPIGIEADSLTREPSHLGLFADLTTHDGRGEPTTTASPTGRASRLCSR